MQTADQKLLERWYAQGDANAFREITARYANLVFAAAQRVLKNASDAEEVAQECFETLALRCDTAPACLGAWLHTAATNRALSLLRSSQSRRAREQRAAAAAPEYTRTEWDDLYEHVDAAIAELPDEFRAAVVGHFLEGRSKADLARALGVSRPAIHYRIDRGLEQVRHALHRRGVTASAGAFASAMAAQASEAAPASLIAGLGRLAVTSLPAMGGGASPVLTTTIAGSILMKKALILGVAIVAILGGVAIVFNQRPPVIPPTTESTPGVELAAKPESIDEVDATYDGTTQEPTDAVEVPEPSDASTPVAAGPPDSMVAPAGNLTIAGRVVDEFGRGLGGVFVETRSTQVPSIVNTLTEEDGRFQIAGLAVGLHHYLARREAYSDLRMEVDAGDTNVAIVMRRLVAVSGHVIDARTGSPVKRFTVSAHAGQANRMFPVEAKERHQVNDPSGKFDLNAVDAEGATIVVSAEKYATVYTPFNLESGNSAPDITIALHPGAVAKGIVTDPDGNRIPDALIFSSPVANAHLARVGAGVANTTTTPIVDLLLAKSDQDGVFSVDTLSGEEEALYAFHPEHGGGQTPINWIGLQPIGDVSIVLEGRGAVDVLVTMGGKPAEGIRIFAMEAGGKGEVLQSGGTGPDGHARLPDLPARVVGLSVMCVDREGNARYTIVDTEIVAGKTTPVAVELQPATAALEGQVRLGGQMASNGRIRIRIVDGDRMEPFGAALNPDGTFTVEAISAGEGTLKVNATFEDFDRMKTLPIVIVAGERKHLDIDFLAGGKIEGNVAGVPIEGNGWVAALRGEHVIEELTPDASRSIEAFIEGSATADASGEYRIEGVTAGRYTVLARVTGWDHYVGPDAAKIATAVVDVVDGETTTVDFDMSE